MAATGRLVTNERHQTSKSIIGAAVLFLVPGLLSWSIRGLKFDIGDWIVILGCTLLFGMGIWARWMPLLPAIMCLAIYAGLVGLQFLRGVKLGTIAWIVEGSILLLLVIALVAALGSKSAPPATESK